MKTKNNLFKSHGNGSFKRKDFNKIGKNVVFEKGALVFHPENIDIGNNVYIGHYSMLKGYYKGRFIIGNNVWIGQNCFFHSAGSIIIGNDVGIGPGVYILTSAHDISNINLPILHSPIISKKVAIEDGADIGTCAIILPGVTIGKGAQIGAGAVVTKDVKPFSVVAGVPAKLLKTRGKI
jgi:acetyltransferase-like isoleucine patch superfamily enzyme